MTIATASNSLAQVTFPRTGKRGVPQQFPRRLFEMLDSETRLIESSQNHPKVITWSESGRAFRIYDASEFALTVLPKYFRTKKFSSFQRNLNLYGFTKVRRGPETDMYSHPSFVRDHPESLLQLRKITNASRRRSHSDSSHSFATRPVSPSASASTCSESSSPHNSFAFVPTKAPYSNVPRKLTLSRIGSSSSCTTDTTADRGRLDLLAMALEREFAQAH